MKAQATFILCQNLKKVLRKNGTATMNKNGLFCRKALTDEAIKIIVPKLYKRTLFYHGHYQMFVEHPVRRWMYNVRRTLLPFMASDVHELLFICKSYRQHGPSQKHQQ